MRPGIPALTGMAMLTATRHSLGINHRSVPRRGSSRRFLLLIFLLAAIAIVTCAYMIHVWA